MAGEKPVSTYDPKKESIGQLLSLTNPSIVVPDFQRNYSWKSEHVDTFWNDLAYFMGKEGDVLANEYFLGSIVIVRAEDGDLKLLDGQQRLATSATLLSVIRDNIRTYKADAAGQIQSNYLVGHDYVTDSVIHKLRLNTYDRDFFRHLVLQDRDADYQAPEPTMASHNLLANTRRIFEKNVAQAIDGLQPKEAFEKCMKISKCLLQHMTVIAVYSTDEDNAAEVFETLNDRGIGLSTPDLLRNLIIRRAPDGSQETVVALWTPVVSFNNDNSIKNFLRHFWVSRHGDVKTQSLYREIKRVVLEKDLDSVELSKQLAESAELYKQIRGAETGHDDIDKLLAEIASYGSSSNILYPAVLGLFEELDSKTAAACIDLLHNVFVRHSIISGLENSRLENRIYRAIRDLRDDEDISAFKSTIVEGTPDDDETEQAFGRLSVTNNGARRSLLKRLELALRTTEEIDVGPPDRVHVEHIYPQRPVEHEKWPDHEKVVNRLGNLTLLSARLNMAIKNGNFDKKRDSFGQSELLLTNGLAKLDAWNLDSLEQRQQDMAKRVPILWPIQFD